MTESEIIPILVKIGHTGAHPTLPSGRGPCWSRLCFIASARQQRNYMAKSTTASGKTPAATAASGKAPAARDMMAPRGWATAPRTVRQAVLLMLAGAAATFVWGVYQAVVSLGFRSTLADYYVKVDH